MTFYVDGVAALATMRTLRGLTPGQCLRAVWLAYSAHGAHSEQTYATSADAERATGGWHRGDWNPPAGVPVWFGDSPTSKDGDVGISSGGGNGVFVWGTGVHEVTLQQRAAEINRPYHGWTDRFMTDNIITYAGASGSTGGFLMALSDQQQQAIYDAIFGTNGGLASLPDGINLPTAINRIYGVVAQPVVRTDASRSQIQDNADTNTMVRSLTASVGALTESVKTIAGATGADPAVIEAAAKRGAAAALADLILKPVTR